jgi:hypothetical protein
MYLTAPSLMVLMGKYLIIPQLGNVQHRKEKILPYFPRSSHFNTPKIPSGDTKEQCYHIALSSGNHHL